MAKLVTIAKVNDIKEGKGKVFTIEDKEIALFKIGDEFYAIDNHCAHKGAPLGEGMIDKNIVTCPWHGWMYDVKTGNSLTIPGIKVKSYKTKIEKNEIQVELD